MKVITEFENLCIYRIHENGIHEFIILDFTRAGVDAFVKALEAMYEVAPAGIPRPVLIDTSRGLSPLSYVFSKVPPAIRWDSNKSPESPIAILTSNNIVSGMISEMGRRFLRMNLRLFTEHQYDEAVKWLVKTVPR